MDPTSHTPRRGHALLKVGASLLTICGIGWGIITLSPSDSDTSEHVMEVKESRADVLWPLVSAPSHTQRFASALGDLGHEPPRVYDLNGNEVFFSTRTTHKMPDELVAEYQRKFVEQGINTKMRMTSPLSVSQLDPNEAVNTRFDELAEASMNGEVLPMRVSKQYMMMSGLLIDKLGEDTPREIVDGQLARQADKFERHSQKLISAYEECGGDPALVHPDKVDPEGFAVDAGRRMLKAKAKQEGSSCSGGANGGVCNEVTNRMFEATRTIQAYVEALEKQPELGSCPHLKAVGAFAARQSNIEFSEKVRAFRSIEAFRHPTEPKTVVTASWSDENFDLTKMDTERNGFPDDHPYERVPTCESCERGLSFDGNGAESPYSANVMYSHDSVAQVASDYRRMMAEKGWAQRDESGLERALHDGMDSPVRPKAGEQWLRFSRGNNHITMRIANDPQNNRTKITAFSAD